MNLWPVILLFILGAIAERIGLGPISLLLLAYPVLFLGVWAGLAATSSAVGVKKPKIKLEGPWRVMEVAGFRERRWRVTAYLRVSGPRVTPDELDLVTGWGRMRTVVEMLRAGTDYLFLLKRSDNETKFYLGASAEDKDASVAAKKVELALKTAKRVFEDVGCRVELVKAREVEPPLTRRKGKAWHLAAFALALAFLLNRLRLSFSFTWAALAASCAIALTVALLESRGSEFFSCRGIKALKPNPAPDMTKFEALSSLAFAYEALNWYEGDFYVKIVFRRADEEEKRLREEYTRREKASRALELPGLELSSTHLRGLLDRIAYNRERLFIAGGVAIGSDTLYSVLKSLGWEVVDVPPQVVKKIIWM